MPFVPFHDHFPEVAERETRSIMVLQDASPDLPLAEYALVEMFCDEPGCDCRRVMFYVVSSTKKDVEAVVAYGWESRRFYAKWLGDDDPVAINELQGPILNLGSPQSELAPAILDMIEKVVLHDQTYVDRVKRHYAMFREQVDNKPLRTRKKSNMRKKKSNRRRKRKA